MKNIVIIGNGIAGTTAARHIRKMSDHKVTIISEETKYFYSRTALMYVYMGHMKFEDIQPYENWFWDKNNIDLVQTRVLSIDSDNNKLTLQNGQVIPYDELILATGSRSNKFGWPGQDLLGVQGLYHAQDLQMMENSTRGIDRAVIVGGGLIGIEMAEMLLTRNIKVTMLVREEAFWNGILPLGEAEFIGRHIKEHHIDLQLTTELKEVLDDGHGHVKGVVASSGETIDCQFVGLTVGVHPNKVLVENTAIESDRGILIDEYFKTSVGNIFSIGDCAQHRSPPEGRRPVEQVWYTGKIMGEALAKNICGDPAKYNPGIWFNSAKFLDIEYQTYGIVMPQTPEGDESFFWEDAAAKVCMRLNFDASTRVFKAANLFGIRGRHTVFEHWIAKKATIDEVLSNLKAANFDPEFFKSYEDSIVSAFNKQFGTSIKSTAKKGLLGGFFRSRQGVAV